MSIPYGTDYPDTPWIDRDGKPIDNDPDLGFWSQRDILKHIHTFARSRSVSPYATLGCVLRRAVGCVEPSVKLPPLVGNAASINLYTVTAGRSGQGKDAADAAGFVAVRFPGDNGEYRDADRPNVGSGEGLARLFKGHSDAPGLTCAHVIVNEVKTLEGLFGRTGATLNGELLKAYMGQPLGFSNAQRDTTTAVPEHSYRLCLGVGVQPENAGFFLSREKDGFPQRFLWLSAIDPYAPRDRPEGVDSRDVIIPDFGNDEYLINVPATVAREVTDCRHLILTGSEEVDPLDGHLMLTRLKISFALAILEGRKDIAESDWKIGGELLDLSKQVRDGMRRTIAQVHSRENQARAHDQADRQAIIDTRLDDDRQRRVAKAISQKLKRTGTATRRELRMACNHSIRDDFEPVFRLFLDKEFIVCKEAGEGRKTQYALNDDQLKGVM